MDVQYLEGPEARLKAYLSRFDDCFARCEHWRNFWRNIVGMKTGCVGVCCISFVMNTSMSTLLLVAFQRWRVERCFEDQKQEVGLDCFEGHRYLGLKRHLILTAISYLFLSRACQQERGKIQRGQSGRSAMQPTRSSRVGTYPLRRGEQCSSASPPGLATIKAATPR